MRVSSIAFVLWVSGAALAGQTPTAAPEVHPSDLGFSYSLPSDWEVVNASPTLSGVKEQAQQNAATEDEKKGSEEVTGLDHVRQPGHYLPPLLAPGLLDLNISSMRSVTT